MNKLWELISKTQFTEMTKIKIFLFLNSVVCSMIGFLIWLVVRRFTLSTIDWGICFVGYPAFFIGYLGGLCFICRK